MSRMSSRWNFVWLSHWRWLQQLIGSLLIVALVIGAGQIWVLEMITQERIDMAIVNVSGRQRMLSQAISKVAIALQDARKPEDAKVLANELEGILQSMQQERLALIEGNDTLGLTRGGVSTIRTSMLELEPQFQRMMAGGQQLLALFRSSGDRLPGEEEVHGPVQKILAEEKIFLSRMNDIVHEYANIAAERIGRVAQVEMGLLVLALVTFLVVGPVFLAPALGRAEKNLRLLAEAVGHVREGVLISQGKPGELPSTAVFANRAFGDLFQSFPETITRREIVQFFSSDEENEMLERTAAAIWSGTSYRGRLNAIREDGSKFLMEYHIAPVCDPRGRVSHFVSIHRDITARHQAESQLRLEKEFIENVLESAQEIVLVVDLSGTVNRFNRYTERRIGRTIAEMKGRNWNTECVPADYQARFDRLLDQAILEGDFGGMMIPLSPKPGSPFLLEFEWAARLLRDAQGEPSGVLCLGHDLSELARAREKALQSERLAAIGEMIAGLAHESRNALQRSQACLELLRLRLNVAMNGTATGGAGESPAEPTTAAASSATSAEAKRFHEVIELVDDIQDAQDHLHRLYEEVREYATTYRPKYEVCEPSKLLRKEWDNLSILRQGRSTELREQWEATDQRLKADPHLVRQVFRNILANALAAKEEEVLVNVHWQETQEYGQSWLRVIVRDNGPGLPQEVCERIFEPFFTTKTHGTGLGMAITKRIIDAHGGRITAQTAATGGAEIIIDWMREPVA